MITHFNYSIPFLTKIRSYCMKFSYSSYFINQTLKPSTTDFYYTVALDNLELFHFFPEDTCHFIFKNYILFDSLKDSIYATLVTSILENKIISQDIFHQCLRCHNYLKYTCDCNEHTNNQCAYSYKLINESHGTENYLLSFIHFKNFSIDKLMKSVRDKI